MISLFVDTCDSNYIVSIVKDDIILFFFKSENSKDLSTKLMPKIEEAFNKTSLKINDVDCIYVTNGPGSFTGIRIGLTAMKTLAYTLNKKLIPISKLELLASTYCHTDFIVPYIDARRNFVYAGIYDQKLNLIEPDQYISVEKLKELINGKEVTFISYSSLFESTVLPKEDVIKIIKKHKNDKIFNPHGINPNYLKKTEAEEKYDQRN